MTLICNISYNPEINIITFMAALRSKTRCRLKSMFPDTKCHEGWGEETSQLPSGFGARRTSKSMK